MIRLWRQTLSRVRRLTGNNEESTDGSCSAHRILFVYITWTLQLLYGLHCPACACITSNPWLFYKPQGQTTTSASRAATTRCHKGLDIHTLHTEFQEHMNHPDLEVLIHHPIIISSAATSKTPKLRQGSQPPLLSPENYHSGNIHLPTLVNPVVSAATI